MYLLQHSCAQKVPCDRFVGRRIEHAVGQLPNVVPQRLPLFFRRPHIWPLEERHDIPKLGTENLTD
jgi:hypothetical protein